MAHVTTQQGNAPLAYAAHTINGASTVAALSDADSDTDHGSVSDDGSGSSAVTASAGLGHTTLVKQGEEDMEYEEEEHEEEGQEDEEEEEEEEEGQEEEQKVAEEPGSTEAATERKKGQEAQMVENGKEADRENKRKLTLLDLPVDILKDIVKEVTHTNDLTSLALCHSALHRLAIPHIYSRFDIVWPDVTTPTETRTGVDALTYGLATLVMSEDVFARPSSRPSGHSSMTTSRTAPSAPVDVGIKRRRGNYYAQFTKKFSIGNGPPDWISEYLITKEGGKMLGTLVALALARMRILETFIWDMPTGVLRDVYIALSSLGDRPDGQACRLERVAIRCHDNSADLQAHQRLPSSNVVSPLQTLTHVEHPSFSILPPLKSLSVFDVDELQYLDEMAVLIGRSQAKLRHLRVGISRHVHREWTTVWEGDQLQQVDKDNPTAGCVTIGERRLGGILGVLTGWVFDLRKATSLPHHPKRLRRRSNVTVAPLQSSGHGVSVQTNSSNAVVTDPAAQLALSVEAIANDLASSATTAAGTAASEVHDVANSIPLPGSSSANSKTSSPAPLTPQPVGEPHGQNHAAERSSSHDAQRSSTKSDQKPISRPPDDEERGLAGKLSLEVLELERVPLSIPIMQHALDWSKLTTLTLLKCGNHEQLWKALRRLYSPSAAGRHYSTADPNQPSPKSLRPAPSARSDYQLRLTKIHTDTVTPAFISFVKDTLAPNSLEWIFLQDACNSSRSSVTIDQIYKGVLRRHRSSLSKVLIDSSERTSDDQMLIGLASARWALDREFIDFVTSGKMPALRELGMAIDYRDWHFFLQRLPRIPHLRSLFMPYMRNHPSKLSDPREMALQIVDIITLRPEVELCYIGIANKCFEILERHGGPNGRDDSVFGGALGVDGGGSDVDAEDDEDDVDEDEDEEDDEESQDSDAEVSDEIDSDSSDDDDSRDESLMDLRLREILYYDDKVTIFKARHGKL